VTATLADLKFDLVETLEFDNLIVSSGDDGLGGPNARRAAAPHRAGRISPTVGRQELDEEHAGVDRTMAARPRSEYRPVHDSTMTNDVHTSRQSAVYE